MLIYGCHDKEGSGIVPDGGWCLDLIALNQKPQGKAYNTRLNWLVRLDWGYNGAGTIPKEADMPLYLENLAEFVSSSSGVWGYIVGNEPNHEQEWPDGEEIEVARYAQCFVQSREIIRQVGVSDAPIRVSPAAIAPYQLSSIPYWKQMLNILDTLMTPPDFLSLHAYTRGANPAAVSQDLRMDAPLESYQSGFNTYKDFLAAVPTSFTTLPSVITEFDEYEPWVDANTGVVQAAYENITLHNNQPLAQIVLGLLLYRFPRYDKWFIDGKQGVVSDFLESSQNGVEAPTLNDTPIYSTILPSITKNATSTPLRGPSGQYSGASIDPRATARGVRVQKAESYPAWKVTELKWYNEKEADSIGGDHHLYYDTLDEQGNRLVGVNILVRWSTGFTKVTSEAKPGEPYSANYPMTPGQNAFSTRVIDAIASDTIEGLGMGEDTPGGWNAGVHTSYTIKFQRFQGSDVPKPPVEKPKIQLQPPFNGPKAPPITQYFGPSPDYQGLLKGHEGLDFACPQGWFVLATADGVALEVGELPESYGKYVKLGHPWGETLYAHLSEHLVLVNTQVKVGQVLGKSGSTGNSTGPHLHFGVRVLPYDRTDGYLGYSDPLPYLPESWLQVDGIPIEPKAGVLQAIHVASQESGVDEDLLRSLAWAESSFRTDSEDGLFQIGDATWSDYAKSGQDINNPLDNARVGAAYLKWLLQQFNGDVWKSLEAYNFGIGNILNGEAVPQETTTYVNKIIHGRDLLKAVRNG